MFGGRSSTSRMKRFASAIGIGKNSKGKEAAKEAHPDMSKLTILVSQYLSTLSDLVQLQHKGVVLEHGSNAKLEIFNHATNQNFITLVEEFNNIRLGDIQGSLLKGLNISVTNIKGLSQIDFSQLETDINNHLANLVQDDVFFKSFKASVDKVAYSVSDENVEKIKQIAEEILNNIFPDQEIFNKLLKNMFMIMKNDENLNALMLTRLRELLSSALLGNLISQVNKLRHEEMFLNANWSALFNSAIVVFMQPATTKLPTSRSSTNLKHRSVRLATELFREKKRPENDEAKEREINELNDFAEKLETGQKSTHQNGLR